MASLCSELMECTSQGCSVSRMWIIRVRSDGDRHGQQGLAHGLQTVTQSAEPNDPDKVMGLLSTM
jgi:hypothetical protein